MAALKDLDYFVPNETEAETITGSPVKDGRRCEEMRGKLLDGGIRRVIITLGANGSLLASSEGHEHVPPFSVEQCR